MTIQIFDCDQSSPEWHACRLGIPTASRFATVMANGRDGGPSVTRREYLYKLAGEIMTGDLMDNYSNHHMDRGKEMEDEARNMYAFMTDAIPQRVGFIRNGMKGGSPDSLIGASGLLEVKTKLPHLTIECLLKDDFPPEHKAQCQGNLWISEREWIDIAVYWPKLPLFVKRAYRDAPYISKLSDAVDRFNEELAATVDRVRNYGQIAEAA